MQWLALVRSDQSDGQRNPPKDIHGELTHLFSPHLLDAQAELAKTH